MNKLTNSFFRNTPLSNNGYDIIILFFRIFAGAIMLPYGIKKIVGFDAYCVDFFGDPIGIGMVPSLILTIFAQIVCVGTLILGLFSRPSAAILAINMAVAVKYHWHDSLGVISLPIVCLAMYVFLTFTGAGRYSLDSLLFKQKNYYNKY